MVTVTIHYSEYRYTHVMRRLVDALDVPCFPVAMKSFASETGRDVALLLEVIVCRCQLLSVIVCLRFLLTHQ